MRACASALFFAAVMAGIPQARAADAINCPVERMSPDARAIWGRNSALALIEGEKARDKLEDSNDLLRAISACKTEFNWSLAATRLASAYTSAFLAKATLRDRVTAAGVDAARVDAGFGDLSPDLRRALIAGAPDSKTVEAMIAVFRRRGIVMTKVGELTPAGEAVYAYVFMLCHIAIDRVDFEKA